MQPKQKTLMIYHSRLCEIGGVETFLYNFVVNLWKYYRIQILYESGDYKQIKRVSKYAEMVKFEPKTTYKCDKFIRNSVWGPIPDVSSKRYIEMRHANYKYLKEQGILEAEYSPFNKPVEVVGCGEFVSKMSNLVLHDHPTTIKNILEPTRETNKVLHLISCTRIDSEKGGWRMQRLCEMLREAGIKFDWKIFTNGPHELEGEEIHYYSPRFDIWDYLADADYTVLLSSVEGLPYTVQESIQYKTPCIVTDIPGCTELIKNGKNGYVVPLDMKFNVKKLLKIPVLKDYDNHAKEKWLEFLGDGVYVEKTPYKEQEIPLERLKVVQTCEYSKYGEIIELKPAKNKLMGWLIEGDEILVSEDEAKRLIKDKICVRG